MTVLLALTIEQEENCDKLRSSADWIRNACCTKL